MGSDVFIELAAHGVFPDLELACQFLQEGFQEDPVIDGGDDGKDHGRNGRFPFEGRHIELLQRPHEHVIEHIRRFIDSLAEFFRSGGVDVFIRILPLRQGQDADAHAQAADDFHGPPCRVHIVPQDGFFGLALQEPRLFRRKRRPQGRDDITDAPVMSGYDIHIAFDQDSLALLINRFVGQVHGEEKASLIENRRFRRIEVLRLAVVEDAAAETDDAAAAITDGKHDPPAEGIVKVAVLFLGQPQED